MSYRYERYERYDERSRRSPYRRWLIALVVLVWVLLLGLLLARFVARPFLTRVVEQRVEDRIAVLRPAEIRPEVGTQVPAAGEASSLIITETAANQWIADHRGEFQGLDDVRIRFDPGEAQADLTVGGITSTARGGVQVTNGQVAITNPRLDPPLSLIVDVAPFAALIQERINSDLASLGRTVTSVTIQEGQVQITVE